MRGTSGVVQDDTIRPQDTDCRQPASCCAVKRLLLVCSGYFGYISELFDVSIAANMFLRLLESPGNIDQVVIVSL